MIGMGENPVLTCYRGPDSSGAVQLGALLAGGLRQPLVLASAYRYEPVALSARAIPPASTSNATNVLACAMVGTPMIAVRAQATPEP